MSHKDLPARGALTTLRQLRQTQFGRQARRYFQEGSDLRHHPK